MQSDAFVLGVDGGGSKTTVWIARRVAAADDRPVGATTGGSTNPMAVGIEVALANLDRAVDAAFCAAGLPCQSVYSACLGIAGSDRPAIRDKLIDWAKRRKLANRILVVHDAEPVLAAGTPSGWGVALIAGTGSFVFGQNAAGSLARVGGWGRVFGDEGSGYAIAVAGLRAVAKAADGRGTSTSLMGRFLQHLNLSQPSELITYVYQTGMDDGSIAALAELVFAAAKDGDPVAGQIVELAAEELAEMVAAVVRRLQLNAELCPLAVSGGVLTNSRRLQKRIGQLLVDCGLILQPISVVTEPVVGAIKLARSESVE